MHSAAPVPPTTSVYATDRFGRTSANRSYAEVTDSSLGIVAEAWTMTYDAKGREFEVIQTDWTDETGARLSTP